MDTIFLSVLPPDNLRVFQVLPFLGPSAQLGGGSAGFGGSREDRERFFLDEAVVSEAQHEFFGENIQFRSLSGREKVSPFHLGGSVAAVVRGGTAPCVVFLELPT